VRHLVFAQRHEPSVDLAALVNNARRYFEAEVDVLDASSPTPERTELLLRSDRYGYRGVFRLTARAAEPRDWSRADAAEIAGRAAGMGDLARRCSVVWELDPVEPVDERAILNLCALLASVALGPVLPPDGSTLLGVRSSMLRLEKLLAPSH
jgi:hypothetical protein